MVRRQVQVLSPVMTDGLGDGCLAYSELGSVPCLLLLRALDDESISFEKP
jgi:hypothetical protein